MTHRILAVDDEPHMLELLQRIVQEQTPYQITTTPSALEVPDLLAHGAFDVIISDLKMPGMDGLDILQHVQEHDRQEVVVIITAFATLDTAMEALSRGVFDYLTKPFKKQQLLSTLERAMRWQGLKREAFDLATVFAHEPYEAAREAFDRKYARRAFQRAGRDVEQAAQRTGLPRETIETLLKD